MAYAEVGSELEALRDAVDNLENRLEQERARGDRLREDVEALQVLEEVADCHTCNRQRIVEDAAVRMLPALLARPSNLDRQSTIVNAVAWARQLADELEDLFRRR